jgi:hypothetical protein
MKLPHLFAPLGREARRSLSGQGAGASLLASSAGLAIGCFLILFAIQAAYGLSGLLRRELGQAAGAYLVISHKASILGTLTRSGRRFTRGEMDELRGQPFVSDLGAVTMSRFRARLTGTASMPFVTELFFECVPERFLDGIPEGWAWSEGDRTIPLIISREFLDLYNYGFAIAYGLPQLTRHTVSSLELSLEVENESFTARVVGFSDRYNSILAPESFIAWANARFSPSGRDDPARLVVRAGRPYSRQIAAFLERKGYETNREKLKNSRLSSLLFILAGATVSGGLMITCLALLVAVLSFQLSMTRRDWDIRLLLHLGIPSRAVVGHYVGRASVLIALSCLSGLGAAVICSRHLARFLEQSGFVIPAGVSWVTIASAFGLAIVGIGCHAWMIRKHVNGLG